MHIKDVSRKSGAAGNSEVMNTPLHSSYIGPDVAVWCKGGCDDLFVEGLPAVLGGPIHQR